MLADRYKSAIADFEQELTLNPQSADARVGIGIAHAKQGDYEAAWKDFFIVTDEIHDNNEAALANQKIMMDAVKGGSSRFEDARASLGMEKIMMDAAKGKQK